MKFPGKGWILALLLGFIPAAHSDQMAHSSTHASIQELFEGTGVIDRHLSGSETPQVSGTTGFRWGGLIRSQTGHTNRTIEFNRGLRVVNSLHSGSYVYAVFSSAGDGKAILEVDLSATDATVVWDISRKRSLEPAGAVRHLLRDKTGQWYISDPELLDSSATEQRLETPVPSLTWYQIDRSHGMRMNRPEGAADTERGERELTWSQSASIPDLSRVSGGGLYIENGWDNWVEGGINVTQIASAEWRSGLPELGVETISGPFADGQMFGPDLPDTRAIFLTNTGGGVLEVASLDIEGGTGSGHFTLDTRGPLSLAAGERTAVHVTYDPGDDPGLHQSRLVLRHQAAGAEDTSTAVPLIGRPLIDEDFPGGNIIVDAVEGSDLFMRPDLRDTARWWFYWSFRIRGAQNQTLNFHFNQFEPRGPITIGARGPAFSRDGGVNWEWLGTHASRETPFQFSFGPDDKDLLFSFGIPYWESHLQPFLRRHEGSPHFRRDVLTLSRQGREVERLHLGQLEGDPTFRVFLASGHHACEMMAIYTLEGMMETMLEDSEAGQWLRTHVEMLAIPFVDKDGVEEGDQGKGRVPWDHVGDYRKNPLYPETAAIMDFVPGWAEDKLELVIDFHCPYVGGAFHEVLMTPVRLRGPEEEWRLVEGFLEVLEDIQNGPLEFRLIDSQEFAGWDAANPVTEREPYNPVHFPGWARRTFPGVTAFPIEVPYANVRWDRAHPDGAEVNAESARLFGRDLGQAMYVWLKAKLEGPESSPAR